MRCEGILIQDRCKGKYFLMMEILEPSSDTDCRGDPILQQFMNNRQSNATMLSPEIQNEIIELFGNMIQRKIVSMTNSALCFSVLADECSDSSTTEQLSLSIRFVKRKIKTETYEI